MVHRDKLARTPPQAKRAARACKASRTQEIFGDCDGKLLSA